MEQHRKTQDYALGTSLQMAWGATNPTPASGGMKLPNIADKLQNDEQAMREWCAKIAEIRRKTTP